MVDSTFLTLPSIEVWSHLTFMLRNGCVLLNSVVQRPSVLKYLSVQPAVIYSQPLSRSLHGKFRIYSLSGQEEEDK